MTVGEYICKYRKEHKLSLREFAEKTKGLSFSYISVLEKGYSPTTKKPVVPSVDTLDKIAQATGRTLDELVRILDKDQMVNIPKETYDDEGIAIREVRRQSEQSAMDQLQAALDRIKNEQNNNLTDGERDLLLTYRSMTPKQKMLLKNYMDLMVER